MIRTALFARPSAALLGALGRVVRPMSYGSALATGRALGCVWYHALPVRRSTVERSLARTFPRWNEARIRQVTLGVLQNVAGSVTTLLWATSGVDRTEELSHICEFEGWEHWEAIRSRGAVVACSHTGNFDLAALAAAARGVKLAVLSRNLSSGPVDRMWRGRRSGAGIDIVDDSASLARIGTLAGPGRALALMIDQRTGPGQGGACCRFCSVRPGPRPCPRWCR